MIVVRPQMEMEALRPDREFFLFMGEFMPAFEPGDGAVQMRIRGGNRGQTAAPQRRQLPIALRGRLVASGTRTEVWQFHVSATGPAPRPD